MSAKTAAAATIVPAPHDMARQRRLLDDRLVSAADDNSSASGLLGPLLIILLPDDNSVARLGLSRRRIPTAHHDLSIAGGQGIAGVALRARADRPVVPHLTDGALAARAHTRVATVEVEAGEAGRTFVVVLAVALLAEDVGIAFEARRAFAGGAAALGAAARPLAAGTGLAGIRLLLAAGNSVLHGDKAGQAAAHRVALPVDLAARVGPAGAGLAGVGGRCAGLDSRAAGDGVGLGRKAGEAGAHRVAQAVHRAFRARAARGRLARVRPDRAPVVLADVARAAIRIPLALPAAAGDRVRLGDVGGQAAADGISVSGDRALCVGPAGRRVAGIRLVRAAVVHADARAAAAIRIAFALPLAAGNGVRHGDEAGEAAADGIAGTVRHALGVGAAGGRRTGVRLHHTPLALVKRAYKLAKCEVSSMLKGL